MMKRGLIKNRIIGVVMILILLAAAACTAGSPSQAAGGSESGQPGQTTVVQGQVKSISAKSWNVAGHELVVSENTKIDSGIGVGDAVKVLVRDNDDGTTVALQIFSDVATSGSDAAIFDDLNDNGDDDMNDNGDDDMNDNGDDDMNDNGDDGANDNGDDGANDNGDDSENDNEDDSENENDHSDDNDNSDDGPGYYDNDNEVDD
jgi:hypothetical protein